GQGRVSGDRAVDLRRRVPHGDGTGRRRVRPAQGQGRERHRDRGALPDGAGARRLEGQRRHDPPGFGHDLAVWRSGMDFDFTPEQQSFRNEVRSWLASHVPSSLKGRGFAASRADRAQVDQLRQWQRALHGAGYVGIDWPREYGGRGASIMEQIILYEEMSRAQAPQPVNRGGLSMLGPTLMKHGTPPQRERHLTKILTAEEIWCQGFSEPN